MSTYGDSEMLLGISRYHQQHERYYTAAELEIAAELRRHANTLKLLADRWSVVVAEDRVVSSEERYQDPKLRVVGCDDLNELLAIPHIGVLFMEGESAPRELTEIEERLQQLADRYEYFAGWLSEKMGPAWEREGSLLTSEFVGAAHARYMALIGTTNSASQMDMAAKILRLAGKALGDLDFTPQAARAGLRNVAVRTRTVGWLLDQASSVIADQAGRLGDSDPWWHEFNEEVARVAGSDPGI